MKKLRIASILLLIMTLLLAFSCKPDTPEPVAVTGITLDQTGTVDVTEGETLKLTATVTPDNADDKTIIWTSGNEAVATVAEDGTVTADAEGEAVITASSQSNPEAKASVTINVIKGTIPVTGITISAENDVTTLLKDETVQLTATVAPENATDTSYTWSSTDDTIATVTPEGLVTAIAESGTVTIKATSDSYDVEGTIEITIVKQHTVQFSWNLPNDVTTADGWSMSDNPGTRSETVKEGSLITAPENLEGYYTYEALGGPEIAVFQLKEWQKADGTAYDFNNPVTEDLALTAVWETAKATIGSIEYNVIWNEEGLNEIFQQETLDENYLLVSELDYSGMEFKASVPTLNGIFNGGGRTISNLTIDNHSSIVNNFIGFIYEISKTGKLENITFDNPSFGISDGFWISFVFSNKGSIVNCHIKEMSTTGNVNPGNAGITGLASYNMQNALIQKCSFLGDLRIDSNVGFTTCFIANQNWGNVDSCNASGSIISVRPTSAGGISVWNYDSGIVNNCTYKNGTLIATKTGGIIGSANNGVISNCKLENVALKNRAEEEQTLVLVGSADEKGTITNCTIDGQPATENTPIE